MNMHSTRFSKTGKEGRGDTSVWTDTPSERAQKAKMKYVTLIFNTFIIQNVFQASMSDMRFP